MLQVRTSSAAAGQATTIRRLPMWAAVLALIAALTVALTLPATSDAARPNRADKLEARSACALERGQTKAERRQFRRAYRARTITGAFNRCVKQQARRLANKRAARRRRSAPPAAPGLPGVPGVPTLPGGIPEMPGVRAECQVAQLEDPLGFQQEYPGGIETCVLMESLP
jgi:hypothetical protein